MDFVKIADLQLYSYCLDLKTTLPIKGGSLNKRKGFILKMVSDTGHTIYSDVAPLPFFHRETEADILNIFPKIADQLIGSHWSLKLLLSHPNILSEHLNPTQFPTLYFALEFALLCHLMPRLDYFQEIKLNAYLSGTDHEILLKAHHLKHYEAIKIKVGPRDSHELLQLINKIHPCLLPHQVLRLDFNRSWSLSMLSHFCERFPLDLCDYLEEPLNNPLELLTFSNDFPHPLGFDESLLDTPLEFLLSIPTKAAFIIKPTLIGSLQKIHYLYSKSRLHDLKFILTSCYESGVGHLMIAQLAHYLAISDPMGLDTYQWIKNDLLIQPLDLSYGMLKLKEQNILNPYINFNLLSKCYEHI